MIVNGNLASWTIIKSENGPSGRMLLSASVAMPIGDIIIHGGHQFGIILKDTWKATIDSAKNEIKWEQLEDSPEDRSEHSSEIIGSHCIFIGGHGCKSTLAYNMLTKE